MHFHKESGDESLVSYGYAPMLKALKHMYFFRPPGSHLPQDPASNNPPNTMDQIPVDGHGIYNCMLHLLSLQILATLTPKAIALGVSGATPAIQKELDSELKKAKAEFEKIFWNSSTGRYRFCDGTGGIAGRTGNIFGNLKLIPPPDAVFLDSFYAQAVASQLGLPDLIDIQHAQQHWNNTIDAFLAPKDANGTPTGPPTMLDENLKHYSMFYFPNKGVLAETSEVIPGIAYMATAAVIYIGRKTGDKELITKGLKMSEAVANMIFDDSGLTTKGMAFGTPESWFVDEVNVCRYTGYSRSRSIWQVVDALDALPKLSR